MRNPLYLGGWFMMAAISLLMPPTGALFTMVLVTLFYVRLILGEEAFLSAKIGEPYREYPERGSQALAAPAFKLPRAAVQPHWMVALVTEVNAIGIFIVIAALAWTYDNLLMIKAVLISFGISLVVRAFMPREEIKADAA